MSETYQPKQHVREMVEEIWQSIIAIATGSELTAEDALWIGAQINARIGRMPGVAALLREQRNRQPPSGGSA